ncbi:hypothetical protein [Verminephrobacter eiseniae]|uniref:hypothetical protein n=1 Tax=Verminephrobacter eiseniae TaxID=364317 RepID=UPI0022387A61|nr:hypothetical protein [Verminephrobacter eiseniae]
MIRSAIGRFPQRVAFIDAGREIDYAALGRHMGGAPTWRGSGLRSYAHHAVEAALAKERGQCIVLQIRQLIRDHLHTTHRQ